ncbi:hypothetical protein KRR38_25905 [Novosphingobium sp. G106]|uniref:hypothetical protein n=1 Tax=Novosphingobium sp. G106 TaxID=2849500 RepID=UPI001C2CD62F|nr:hypothetical protein [Novosphingobium sp. G106]MBV1691019.1 hypothetical protein [Novosphingobium sp. G106]
MTWQATQQIKTFTEEPESGHGARVRSVMAAADVIVFLGFQFHRQNMEILFPRGQQPAKRIYGTTFGMSPRACARLEKSMKDGGNVFRFADMRCPDYLQANYEEIFEH